MELTSEELRRLSKDDLVKEISKEYFVQLVLGSRIDVLVNKKEEVAYVANKYFLSFIGVEYLEDCIRGIYYYECEE